MPSNHKNPKKRKGSALILTLGILSLMMVIAMVFAFDARTSEQASTNHANIVRARLLNEMGHMRALAMIGLLSDRSSTSDPIVQKHVFMRPGVRFLAGPGGTEWEHRQLFPSMVDATSTDSYSAGIQDALQASIGTNYMDFTPNVQLTATACWYTDSHKWDHNATGTFAGSLSDSVLGAFAFLVIDNTGYIDPTEMRSTVPGSFDGGSIGDLNINDMSSSGFPSGAASAYNALAVRSYGDLFRKGSQTNLNSDRLDLLRCAFPGQITDTEVFWNDGAGAMAADSQCADDEVFERLDITQLSSYTTLEIYMFLLCGDSQASPASITLDRQLSPWLKEVIAAGGTQVTNLATARVAAAQMALNLVDYVDADADDQNGNALSPEIIYLEADGTATSNLPSNSEPSPPGAGWQYKVQGVDNVYGLSELMVHLQSTTVAGATQSRVQTAVNFRASLVAPNATPPPGGYTPRITIEYKVTWDGDLGPVLPTPPESVTFTTSAWQPTAATSPAVHDGATVHWDSSNHLDAGSTHTTSIDLATTSGGTYRVSEFEILSVKIEMVAGANTRTCYQYPFNYNNAGYTRFMKWINPAGSHTVSTTGLGSSQDLYVRIKATDPLYAPRDGQHSDFSDFWTASAPDSDPMGTAVPANTIGDATNMYYGASDYCDADARNAAFTRIGELGLVHSAYAPLKSNRFWIYQPGSDGNWQDGALLDMFTATPSGMRARLNPNSGSSRALRVLLNQAGFPDTDNAVDYLRAANGSDGNNLGFPFVHRGQIYKMFNTSVVDAGATPAAVAFYTNKTDDNVVEAALQKVVELTSTRHNYFTIISTSQALKDVGTMSGVPDAVEWSNNQYAVPLSTYKTLIQVHRDVWTGDNQILNVQVLED